MLLKVPGLDRIVLNKIRKSLLTAFGNGFTTGLILGGAALNREVEDLLKRMKFPYVVGYGMTECGPLISYCDKSEFVKYSCGKKANPLELRIDSPDPRKVLGEIQVKGDAVMLGYYKNPEATEAVMKDGWLNTGDLCEIDDNGFLYIRGRSKTMILGPSGQNIYPEEIEQKINNLPYVCESLVVEDSGKLVALIYPDIENGAKQGMDFEALTKLMESNIASLNKELPSYSKIASVKMQSQEFEKTPKRSIKRFLYQH
jgi:long-chain acyl-CoA synthetase